MPKRPPKPEGQKAQPRTKAHKKPTLAAAVENARKLIDLPVDVSDTAYLKTNFEMDDRALAVTRAANVENAVEVALKHVLTIHKGESRLLFRSDGPLGSKQQWPMH